MWRESEEPEGSVFRLRLDASETGFAFQAVGCISAASADGTRGLPVCRQLWVAPPGSSVVVSLCCTWRLADWCFLGKQMLLVSLVRVTSGGWGRLPLSPSAVLLWGSDAAVLSFPTMFSVLTEVCLINACETQNPFREHGKADVSAEETA